MFACFIPKVKMKNILMFGAAVFVIHVLVFRYMVSEDIENVDLGCLEGRTLVVDAGHGGIDSGACYHKLLEKDVNLSIALKLGALLEAQGAKVIYTRASDMDYYTKGKGGKRNDLLTRIDMINSAKADLFISIHCNAVKGGQWYGSQVFYHPRLEENKRLAQTMQLLLKKFPPNNKRGEKEDTHILILDKAKVPGVLLEAGYLSNNREAALLSDATYQEKMALQIAKAMANYFKQKDG